MINYIPILEEKPNGVLATQSGAGVKTRLFQYLFTTEGSKVYFCTSTQKPVYAQLKENPMVSFCTYAPNYNPVLSLNGRAIFDDNYELKKRVLSENPGIEEIYSSPDNPDFQLFYFVPEEIETFSYEEGAKTYVPTFPSV